MNTNNIKDINDNDKEQFEMILKCYKSHEDFYKAMMWACPLIILACGGIVLGITRIILTSIALAKSQNINLNIFYNVRYWVFIIVLSACIAITLQNTYKLVHIKKVIKYIEKNEK